MALAVTLAELQERLSQVSFSRQYGFRLQSFDDGECTLAVPFQKDFERPGGIVAGHVFMAAADIAMWLAIMTRLGKDAMALTVEMKTNFLNGARQEDVLCHAKVLKLGRRLVYGVAECTNREGKLLAHHTITYIRAD